MLRPVACRRKAAACLAENFALHFDFARAIGKIQLRKSKIFCLAPR
jgi:hypothetical protein